MVPLQWYLLAAAKARGKTVDEYIAGGRTRWWHVHQEIAFDIMQARLEEAQLDRDTPSSLTRRPGRKADEASGSERTQE